VDSLYYGWESVTTPPCTIFFIFLIILVIIRTYLGVGKWQDLDFFLKRCAVKSSTKRFLLTCFDDFSFTQNEQSIYASASFLRIQYNKKCLEDFLFNIYLGLRKSKIKYSSKHFLLCSIRWKIALSHIHCSFWVWNRPSEEASKDLFRHLL
jgi:hypothetical protein